jgi:sortase A
MATGRLITLPPGDEWGPLPPHADPRTSGRVWRSLERLLIVVGLVSLGYYAYVSVESRLYQELENRELDAILATNVRALPDTPGAAVAPPPVKARPAHARPPVGSAIGRIEIPRLGVSVVIRAGSDARTLRLAVGHIPGTAFPGEIGNIGLAGHRDTFFRRLKDIRAGDEIRIVTPDGTFPFRVEETSVVMPRDTWVLNATPAPTLTLVTCFPFNYVGSAPQRFIVRAREATQMASRENVKLDR